MEQSRLEKYIKWLNSFEIQEERSRFMGGKTKYRMVSPEAETKDFTTFNNLVADLKAELRKEKESIDMFPAFRGDFTNSMPTNENIEVKDDLPIMESTKDESVGITEEQLPNIEDIVAQWQECEPIQRIHKLEENGKADRDTILELSKKYDDVKQKLDQVNSKYEQMRKYVIELNNTIGKNNKEQAKNISAENNKTNTEPVSKMEDDKSYETKLVEPSKAEATTNSLTGNSRATSFTAAYNQDKNLRCVFKNVLKLRLHPRDEAVRANDKISFISIEASKKVPLIITESEAVYYGIATEDGSGCIMVCPVAHNARDQIVLERTGCEEFFEISKQGDTGRIILAEPALFKQVNQGYVIEKRGSIILI